MGTTEIDLDAYFARLGIRPPEERDAAALAAVHRAQAFAIPFENFDVLLGRGISLEPQALQRKLLGCRRGGYCFELNGLFTLALRALGFAPRTLLARVFRPDTGQPGARTHQLGVLRLEGRDWIADVGFGRGSLREPIVLEADTVHEQDGQAVRLRREGDSAWVYQLRSEGQWRDQYLFHLAEAWPEDLEVANHFTATHPSSPFVHHPMVTRPTPDGRVSLLGDRLRTVVGDRCTEELAPSGAALVGLLHSRFGIELDVDADRLLGGK